MNHFGATVKDSHHAPYDCTDDVKIKVNSSLDVVVHPLLHTDRLNVPCNPKAAVVPSFR